MPSNFKLNVEVDRFEDFSRFIEFCFLFHLVNVWMHFSCFLSLGFSRGSKLLVPSEGMKAINLHKVLLFFSSLGVSDCYRLNLTDHFYG